MKKLTKEEQKKSWEDTFDKEFCITESIVGFTWDKFKNGTLPSEVKQFIKDLLASNKNKILKLLVEGK